MGDDVSAAEVYRRLRDHEQRTQREHDAMETRLANLARDTVPLQLYQQAERGRDDDMRTLSDRVDRVEAQPQMSLTRWLAIITVAAALIGLAIQAYGTLKGAK